MMDNLSLSSESIRVNFFPGDKWFYIKIYLGYHSSDKILRDSIYPMAEKFLTDKIILKWFFIRYWDPDFHLRIRLLLVNRKHNGDVLLEFNNILKPYFQDRTIWKTQLDTYQREVQRYRRNLLPLSESLFFCDSKMVIEILYVINKNKQEDLRWLSGLLALDKFLEDFKLPLQAKLEFCKSAYEKLRDEFQLGKRGRKSMTEKYREYRTLISEWLENSRDLEMAAPIHKKSSCIKDMAEKMVDILNQYHDAKFRDSFIRSHMHMMINRLLPTDQKKYEMVLYYLLYCYYRAKASLSGK